MLMLVVRVICPRVSAVRPPDLLFCLVLSSWLVANKLQREVFSARDPSKSCASRCPVPNSHTRQSQIPAAAVDVSETWGARQVSPCRVRSVGTVGAWKTDREAGKGASQLLFLLVAELHQAHRAPKQLGQCRGRCVNTLWLDSSGIFLSRLVVPSAGRDPAWILCGCPPATASQPVLKCRLLDMERHCLVHQQRFHRRGC